MSSASMSMSLLADYHLTTGPQLATHWIRLTDQSQSHIKTDGQSSVLAPSSFWGPRPDFCCCGFVNGGTVSVICRGHGQQYMSSTCINFASWVLIQLWWPLFCFFWLCPTELCHDLLKYHSDYSEHVIQRWTLYIRSLNWLGTCCLWLKGGGALICPTVAVQARHEGQSKGGVIGREQPYSCSPGCSLRLSFSHLIPGMTTASIVERLRTLSAHQLAACWYQCCTVLFWVLLVKVTAPHHI
jgi:hypothetical protein